jgi:hypothetical protein
VGVEELKHGEDRQGSAHGAGLSFCVVSIKGALGCRRPFGIEQNDK